jgi:hypothetical protein
MTEKYKEYLEQCPVVSEDRFNYIVSILPEYNYCNFGDGYEYEEDIATGIVNSILEKSWDDVYCEDINIDDKEICLGDVQSLKDLEEIKKTFSNWKISNEDEIRYRFTNTKTQALLRKLSPEEIKQLKEALYDF